jgi:hypothetical protein
MAGALAAGNSVRKLSGRLPATPPGAGGAVWLFLFLWPVAVAAEGPAGPDPWAALQERCAVISAVEIHVGNVFDLRDPNQDHWVGRVANVIHIRTRKRVIRREPVFKPGEKVNARLIHESERLLRSLEYVRSARIYPRLNPGGTVTAVVVERDAWTLKGGIRFGRAGGQNTWRIRAHEVDFLGLGKQILISRQRDYERTTNQFSYGDPQQEV